MELQPKQKRFRPIIRLFVSSTFADLKHERDALQRDVFLKLEAYCAERQFQFQAIDLRWGVPSEAGLDHRTMRICFEELKRSQEISPQPNFLILLGDRYGWRPLPEEITEVEFNMLAEAAKDIDNGESTLHKWYQRDDNAIPPVYVLQPRKTDDPYGDFTDDDTWKEVQKILWDIINDAYPVKDLRVRFENEITPDDPLPSIVKFQGSATEQEIWKGALNAPDAKDHVIACFRELSNINDFDINDDIKNFTDLNDDKQSINESSKNAHYDLKKYLESKLEDETVDDEHKKIKSFTAQLIEVEKKKENDPKYDVTTDHIDGLCEHIHERLREIIDQQMKEYWDHEDGEITDERKLELEIQEHLRFGKERAPEQSFVGRKRYLEIIDNYINSDSKAPLVIHGTSGCGKTALLAKAYQNIIKDRNPIILFIGITPNSSDIRSLLSSLCQEFRKTNKRESQLPTDYRELQLEFEEQLNTATAEKPIILFLDALDQLADTDNGLSLSWLLLYNFPDHVKIILSCLSDRNDDDPAGQPYRILHDKYNNSDSLVDLDALDESEAEKLFFNTWLKQAGRTLNTDQTKLIKKRIDSTNCRQPLYLKMLFEMAKHWRSYDTGIQVGDDIISLLDNVLNNLKAPNNHGRLTNYVLGYLSAARYGLSENEILEVLFKDKYYKKYLDRLSKKNHHELPQNPPRIPIAIWARLQSDLTPYIAEQSAPGGPVINFYHRIVGERIKDKFLKLTYHARLADYFDNNPLGDRKFYEYPFQLRSNNEKKRLFEFVSDIGVLYQMMKSQRWEVFSYWKYIENEYDPIPVFNVQIHYLYNKYPNDFLVTLISVNVAEFFSERGQYVASLEVIEICLKYLNSRKNRDFESEAYVNNHLALLYNKTNEFSKSININRCLYNDSIKKYGKINRLTLLYLNNLAYSLFINGIYDEAEDLFMKALHGKEQHSDDIDESKLNTLNNLGLLYLKKQDYESAKQYLSRALRGRQLLFGDKHKATLESQDNLGIVLIKTEEFNLAEKYIRKSLKGYIELLGDKHIDTITCRNNLSGLLITRGSLEEAYEICKKNFQQLFVLVGYKHKLTRSVISTLNYLDSIINETAIDVIGMDLERKKQFYAKVIVINDLIQKTTNQINELAHKKNGSDAIANEKNIMVIENLHKELYAQTLVLTKSEPEKKFSWKSHMIALLGMLKINDALKACDKALAIDNCDAVLWRSKANIMKIIGEHAQAKEANDRADELEKKNKT